jgi:hypothetical protein
MPKMMRPADPSMPIRSIGNMPITKTGSSGRSSNVSDRLRIGELNRNDDGVPPNLGPLAYARQIERT